MSTSQGRLSALQHHLSASPVAGGGRGRLEGKVAMITGAGSGIGRATAMLFAREGAKVSCLDWNEEACQETVNLVKKEGGSAIGARADAGSETDTVLAVKNCVAHFGRLDIYFANAGYRRAPPNQKNYRMTSSLTSYIYLFIGCLARRFLSIWSPRRTLRTLSRSVTSLSSSSSSSLPHVFFFIFLLVVVSSVFCARPT